MNPEPRSQRSHSATQRPYVERCQKLGKAMVEWDVNSRVTKGAHHHGDQTKQARCMVFTCPRMGTRCAETGNTACGPLGVAGAQEG